MAVTPRRLRSERGAELIEFAIVLPILIFVIAGIVDFGMMFQTYEAVTNAAREGARVGVLPGYAAVDVQSRVDAYLAASGLNGTHTTTVVDVPVTTTAGIFTARAVTLSYTYSFVTLRAAAPFFGGSFGTLNLNAASVMRTESQATP
jgi:Flp pilus assembly protein TadG